jgi:LysM repeat protein
MKPRTLPVKRRPVQTGLFRRLSAVTRSRKQRVAAAAPAAAADMDIDDGSSKISRVLTIIFLIHIVAIGLIFVHQKFLEGRTSEVPAIKQVAAAPAPAARVDGPKFSSNDRIYVVKPGDNWQRIALAEQVDENELKLVNEHREIGPGSLLKIPPRRIIAEEPPEVAAIRENTPPDTDRGLVEAVDVSNAPRAQLIRPNTVPPITGNVVGATRATPVSGKTYVIRKGDTLWKIATAHKVNHQAIMDANGIKDATKIRPGDSLVIPQ